MSGRRKQKGKREGFPLQLHIHDINIDFRRKTHKAETEDLSSCRKSKLYMEE